MRVSPAPARRRRCDARRFRRGSTLRSCEGDDQQYITPQAGRSNVAVPPEAADAGAATVPGTRFVHGGAGNRGLRRYPSGRRLATRSLLSSLTLARAGEFARHRQRVDLTPIGCRRRRLLPRSKRQAAHATQAIAAKLFQVVAAMVGHAFITARHDFSFLLVAVRGPGRASHSGN